MGWLSSIIRRDEKDMTAEIVAMSEVIVQLKKENADLKEQYKSLFKRIEEKRTDVEVSMVHLNYYIKTHSIPYEVKNDGEYCRLINLEDEVTISFNREFDTSKGAYNWVNEGEALITLKIDSFNLKLYNPTLVVAPATGIVEYSRNKAIRHGEEICRIKIIPIEQKQSTIEALEYAEIKADVLKKERKKRIQRETLDELIAEGAVFNIYSTPEGNRMTIPSDVANAVWNRDGGKCCYCGSKSDLEFDHIIPISKGGATTFRNLQLLCKACNLKKSDNI